MKIKNPMQPIVMVDNVARFKQNRIVDWMLRQLGAHGITLNEIALTFDQPIDKDDYQQLMQLIGYSVSGYGDLSSCDRKVLGLADKVTAKLVRKRVRKRA